MVSARTWEQRGVGRDRNLAVGTWLENDSLEEDAVAASVAGP